VSVADAQVRRKGSTVSKLVLEYEAIKFQLPQCVFAVLYDISLKSKSDDEYVTAMLPRGIGIKSGTILYALRAIPTGNCWLNCMQSPCSVFNLLGTQIYTDFVLKPGDEGEVVSAIRNSCDLLDSSSGGSKKVSLSRAVKDIRLRCGSPSFTLQLLPDKDRTLPTLTILKVTDYN
jgi:hypothetical protein